MKFDKDFIEQLDKREPKPRTWRDVSVPEPSEQEPAIIPATQMPKSALWCRFCDLLFDPNQRPVCRANSFGRCYSRMEFLP